MFLFFVYSKSRSTSKTFAIQWTFIKEFSDILALFIRIIVPCICISLSLSIYIYVYIYMCVCVSVCACVRVCVCVCVRVCVCSDLLRAIYRLFYLQFCDQVISEKTLCCKGFTSILRDIFK